MKFHLMSHNLLTGTPTAVAAYLTTHHAMRCYYVLAVVKSDELIAQCIGGGKGGARELKPPHFIGPPCDLILP